MIRSILLIGLVIYVAVFSCVTQAQINELKSNKSAYPFGGPGYQMPGRR